MGTVVINGTPRYGEPKKESYVSCLIKNIGEDDLEVQQIQFTNSDFYTTMETPFTILPGNSEEIEFRFKPPIRGKKSGIVKLEDNDPLTKSFQFKIEGKGVDVVEINEMFTEATEPDEDIEYPLPAGYIKYSLDLIIVGGGGTGGQGGRGGDGGRAGKDSVDDCRNCEDPEQRNCTGGGGGPGGGGGGGAGGYAGELVPTTYNTARLIALSIKVGKSDTESSVSYTNEQGELETLTASPGPTGEPGGSCWPGGGDGEDANCNRNACECTDGSDGSDGPGGAGGGSGTPRAGGNGQRGWQGGYGGSGGVGQEGPIAEYPNYGRGGNGSAGSNGGVGVEFGQDSPPGPQITPSPGYPGAVLITVYGYLED